MPSLDEVAYYLRGVWLLVWQNSRGLLWFDFTERGFRRSFWALVLCFPLMIPNWIWWHRIFVGYGPIGVDTGPLFYLRMALVEYVLWFLPFLTVGAFMKLRGLASLFDPMVIVSNWLSVLVYLLAAIVSVLELLVPAPLVVWYVVSQMQLAVVVVAQFSVFYVLVRKNLNNALGMAAAAVLPPLVASVYLNDFLHLTLGP